jgi:hypothetical protein
VLTAFVCETLFTHPQPPTLSSFVSRASWHFPTGNFTVSGGGSTLLIDADGTVLFDTGSLPSTPVNTRQWTPLSVPPLSWTMAADVVPKAGAPDAPPAAAGSTVGKRTTSPAAVEQLALTLDDTQHAYYVTSVSAATLRAAGLLNDGNNAAAAAAASQPLVVNTGKATALSAYFVGSGEAPANAYELTESSGPVTLTIDLSSAGASRALAASGGAAATLVLLSESMGINKFSSIDNTATTFSTTAIKGIVGKVTLGGADITNNGWTSQSGLSGEATPPVWTTAGASQTTWSPVPADGTVEAMTWLRTTFVAPDPSLLKRSMPSEWSNRTRFCPFAFARLGSFAVFVDMSPSAAHIQSVMLV